MPLLDKGKETAPGQVSARELREVYRIGNITRQTQITGLIGLPVCTFSFSSHAQCGFQAAGVDAVYHSI